MTMNFKQRALAGLLALSGLGVLGALGFAGYGLYALGMQRGQGAGAQMSASASASAAAPAFEPEPEGIPQGEAATRRHIGAGIKAGDIDPRTGSRVLYYHDPMMPAQRFDAPAKSPFMDMMLVPVYAPRNGAAASSAASNPAGTSATGSAGEPDAGNTITISPRTQQNLGVRTALVTEGALAAPVTATGNIAFNERDAAVVQARATGYVERLLVRATLDRVAAGQPLAELYVPDWIAAQEEFLALRRMSGADLLPLIDAARQRMRQLGMSAAQIGRVERSGEAQTRLTLVAPMGGVITELLAREGMTVLAGATLFRINGVASVWAVADVPQSQLAQLRVGAAVRATSPAAPGATFDGVVQALLPEVNAGTRTLKARVELKNPRGESGVALLPGMSVQMVFSDLRSAARPGELRLHVPSDAVIQTGQRSVVLVAEDGGHFRSVEVEVGIESGGQTEIRRGLQAGQRVVVSAQFLIDSEASLKAVEARLEAPPPVSKAQPTPSVKP